MPLVLATSPTRPLVGLLDMPSMQHNVVLVDQVKWSDGAEMAVKAGIFQYVRRLVAAPDLPVSIRCMTAQIIEEIAGRKSLMTDVLAAEPYLALVGLLADTEITLRRRALCTLARIAADTDGAQALVEASISAPHSILLEKNESTWIAVLSINPCERLVELARYCRSHHRQLEVCAAAILAPLPMFCIWPDGAEAVGTANMAKQDKPNITLRVVSHGALLCSIAADVPAEVTREDDDETPSSTTTPLRIPFLFREIRLWPKGDVLTIDPPEFMKVAELLAALSLGAPEGQGFAATQLKRPFLDMLKVQGWGYPLQIHNRVLFLAINSPPHTEDQERERQARDIEDEAIFRLHDILVEHAADVDGRDVGFAACSVLVNLVRRERPDGQAGDSGLGFLEGRKEEMYSRHGPSGHLKPAYKAEVRRRIQGGEGALHAVDVDLRATHMYDDTGYSPPPPRTDLRLCAVSPAS
ncbi:hypothetical protein MVEN_02558300 [Mycena venus]|uniref:Uncharacterized protein n=1 Tax=Mycena venus TaxID=2733690 RepID=A0A8H6WRN3_9AGAR|nr:hypothetical protein MVEN_02558300 [Mycena venus]